MVNSLSGLVKTSAVVLPVEDPHPYQTTKDRIIDFIPMGHGELLRSMDHICPQGIVVQLQKLVIPQILGLLVDTWPLEVMFKYFETK